MVRVVGNGRFKWGPCMANTIDDVVQLIEAEWRINASAIYTIIGTDNGLSPGRRLAII